MKDTLKAHIMKPDGTYDKISLEEYVKVLREALKNKDLKPLIHE